MALPANATLAQVVAALDSIGQDGAEFRTWYEAQLKNDPALTPVQGAEVWLVGHGIAQGLGAAATGAGTATGQAASGAAKGAIQAEQTLNPLTWEQAIAKFFGSLTQASTWIRVIKITVGGVMLVGALMKMTGFSAGPQVILQAARKLPGMSTQ